MATFKNMSSNTYTHHQSLKDILKIIPFRAEAANSGPQELLS